MPFSDRVQPAWQKLGVEGVVLLAALLVDLAIVVSAASDSTGPRGRDLLLLPGIVAIFWCALWARTHPARGAFAGAAVLIGSTVLIRLTGAAAYSTLLTDLALTETVAGLELVYFAVRRLRPGTAFVATATLVVAGLFAAVGRSGPSFHSGRINMTLVLGVVFLVASAGTGLWFRQSDRSRHATAATELTGVLRSQWLLVGALCLPLFLELYQLLNDGVRALPLFVCDVASAALAVLASRRPVFSGVLVSGVFLASAPAIWVAPGRLDVALDALPTTEILAGTVIVAFLVRFAPPRAAAAVIALMSASVGLTTALNTTAHGNERNLQTLSGAALLLLGIAVAVGLYLRARDVTRAKVVEAAVTEAQTSERMALARELHDVVAHHVTGIVVQAQAAKLLGGKNPALAHDAFDRIEQAGTEALVAMRRLVGSMRSTADTTEQATTDLGADLRRLVEAGHHGVPTDLDLRLHGEVPQEVARSALRLIQESLTNVGKHAAGATEVVVLAEVRDGELHVRVRDDGLAPDPKPAGGSGGYGLVGMRERVELLHGRFTAGRVENGWTVEAWLPLEGEAA